MDENVADFLNCVMGLQGAVTKLVWECVRIGSGIKAMPISAYEFPHIVEEGTRRFRSRGKRRKFYFSDPLPSYYDDISGDLFSLLSLVADKEDKAPRNPPISVRATPIMQKICKKQLLR